MSRIPILMMLILICGSMMAANQSLLTPAETGQLIQMLQEANLDSLSLNFEKNWDLSTKFKLDWQLNQLQKPWQALSDIQELREACVVADTLPAAIPSLLQKLGSIAFNRQPEEFDRIYTSSAEFYTHQFGKQVKKPVDMVKFYEAQLEPLNLQLTDASRDCTQEQLSQLASFWHWCFIEGEDREKYDEYYKEKGFPPYDSLEVKVVYELMERFNLQSLLSSGIRYQALSDVILEQGRSLKYNNNKPTVRKTKWGLAIIGSPGNDFYTSKMFEEKAVCFIFEPGGNDVYEMNLHTDFHNSFYFLADLSGDDAYRNSTPAGIFCSSFGFGCSYDESGNDLYQTDDFAFSSFMGVNIHQDTAGDDTYRSGLFSQAAAMFGVSLLLDNAGNDTYQASVTSQGLGSTHGVGALLDQSGADTYTLGGKYYHEPLMPLDFITLGQGMGLGLRPDLAGGVGLLYDGTGSDRYQGGVYAQGSGYWYAVGALLDETGNDVYNTVYYPQGSGIHLANGFLFDGAGDDAYYSRNGPGQGAAHDWGMAMFIEGGGNDAYSIPGGNGLALTNSVAVFVDKSGDDRYERREVQNYGSANMARSTGGIGLFLDAGGKDIYPDSLQANNKTWQQGTYGVGRDIELNFITKSAIETLAEAAALPDSTADIADIFAAASEWEVGSAVQRVRKAREILLARAEEAIPYVLKEKMSSDDGLEYRALEALARNSRNFIDALYPLIEGADSLAAKNAMSLIAGVGDSLLVEYVERLMVQKKYQTACLSVLSGVNTARSVELLQSYIHHPSERYRYIVARSLLQIKHPSARSTLLQMSDDSSFLVQALIRNLPPEKP